MQQVLESNRYKEEPGARRVLSCTHFFQAGYLGVHLSSIACMAGVERGRGLREKGRGIAVYH